MNCPECNAENSLKVHKDLVGSSGHPIFCAKCFAFYNANVELVGSKCSNCKTGEIKLEYEKNLTKLFKGFLQEKQGRNVLQKYPTLEKFIKSSKSK